MSSYQEDLFNRDDDPVKLILVDPLNEAKDRYMALGRFDDVKATKGGGHYTKTYEAFEAAYERLSDTDKKAFGRWKEEHGYDW